MKRAEQGGKRNRNGRKCSSAKVCANDRCDTSKQSGERKRPKACRSGTRFITALFPAALNTDQRADCERRSQSLEQFRFHGEASLLTLLRCETDTECIEDMQILVIADAKAAESMRKLKTPVSRLSNIE